MELASHIKAGKIGFPVRERDIDQIIGFKENNLLVFTFGSFEVSKSPRTKKLIWPNSAVPC
jgi:hypothetical protein